MDDANTPSIQDDAAWRTWARRWRLKPGVIYLNHGSFGPSPIPVRQVQQQWRDQLEQQPMEFFLRRLEPALTSSKRRLAELVGAAESDLVFTENSTAAMNIVANSFALRRDDQVLLTDHEYGAVTRIWRRACERAGGQLVVAPLPAHIESTEQVVRGVLAGVTDRTRLLVVSHITSATALILPVREICQEAKQRGIAICIDGPHAVAQVDLRIEQLECDFYTASNHKWLCAPFGSGFLYVAPHQQAQIQPPLLSWGRLKPHRVECWSDEFIWSGTRDPSAYLATEAAVEFFLQVPPPVFRARAHHLAQYARQRLSEITGRDPALPDDSQWYGSMALVPLPPRDLADVYQQLSQKHRIEVMIEEFQGAGYARVSCHLYNDKKQIDTLADALQQILRSTSG